ncbi:fibrinogen gamma chain isoform X2 [Carassius auratus]|uniref:Fibrinogen gamma chain isoform X2 n=1 Tax=Carassius auratus TaxID=7957 RepID=A0A6P6JKH4_CARAU|nr:fibrinogen gamma chain-like isoform X2 [Carassius auratus]
MASYIHVAVSILLLSTLTSVQMRGGSSPAQDICNLNDGFGIYCPTTCGVADYLQRYMPDMDRQLGQLEQDLEDIVNLTRGAQDKVVYLKDSETQTQKQSPEKKRCMAIGCAAEVRVADWLSNTVIEQDQPRRCSRNLPEIDH